jgi:hypothetical protein
MYVYTAYICSQAVVLFERGQRELLQTGGSQLGKIPWSPTLAVKRRKPTERGGQRGWEQET